MLEYKLAQKVVGLATNCKSAAPVISFSKCEGERETYSLTMFPEDFARHA